MASIHTTSINKKNFSYTLDADISIGYSHALIEYYCWVDDGMTPKAGLITIHTLNELVDTKVHTYIHITGNQ